VLVKVLRGSNLLNSRERERERENSVPEHNKIELDRFASIGNVSRRFAACPSSTRKSHHVGIDWVQHLCHSPDRCRTSSALLALLHSGYSDKSTFKRKRSSKTIGSLVAAIAHQGMLFYATIRCLVSCYVTVLLNIVIYLSSLDSRSAYDPGFISSVLCLCVFCFRLNCILHASLHILPVFVSNLMRYIQYSITD
jgi:hypothetical protein